MRTLHWLGLDVGTSGARAVIIDSSGAQIASAQSAMDDHGDNRRDPEQWWQAVSSVLGQLAARADLNSVVAMCIDATSGTVLAVDETGGPLTDALMYNDPVVDRDILEAIAAVAPPTSAVHGASSALARAILLQRQYPHARIVHQADWVAGRLTGVYDISDESNALKTGYDPVSRQWPQWLPATGVDPDRLPRVVPAGTVTGKLRFDGADGLRVQHTTKMVAGMTDGCASFLATGADQVGDCVTALGSTMTMKMLCDRPLFNPEFGIYSHRIGNDWLAGGASNSGGSVLQAFFDDDTLVRLSAEIDPSKPSGLQYYPLLKPGERFPHNDSSWSPVLSPRPDNDALYLQGMFEGMAEIERTGYARLREFGGPEIRSVRSVGGGANNAAWTAIRQRALAAPFEQSLSTDAARGVAGFALQAVPGDAEQ